MTKSILITGIAGFIGFHTAKYLLESNHKVIGIDNLNDYYDVELKEDRLEALKKYDQLTFIKADIHNKASIDEVFSAYSFDYVIHLAAQAGVRHSLTHPYAYIDSNIIGFTNILEACRNTTIKHLIFASSSSVYGKNETLPFNENQSTDCPISLYAATKKSNELMAHVYSHLYKIPCTGVRLFTVYGPWGRPDMAYFKFTEKMLKDETIDVYNHGKMRRDFTYVEDVVKCFDRLLDKAPTDEEDDCLPYRILNIAGSKTYNLMDFISMLEVSLKRTSKKNFLQIQPGDVLDTYGDVTALNDLIAYTPDTNLKDGLDAFVHWYVSYYSS